jgi:dipeptidyl aminopeptidase/acylaminoacyl peptidase
MEVAMKSRLCLPTMLVLLALPVAAAEKVPLTAERSWQIERIGPPSISRDGRWAVVAVTKPDVAENKQAADLWLYATDGSVERRLTADPGDDNSPVFSPDGRSVAFISRRGDEKAPPQIYVIGIDGGEAARVTDWPTGVGQIKWSADGEQLYFLSRVWTDLRTAAEQKGRLDEREKSKVKAQVYEGISYSAWDTLLDERELHLFRVSRTGGEPVAVTLGTGLALPRQNIQIDSVLYDVSPDGNEIAFVADSNPAPNASNLDVFVVATRGGTPVNLTGSNAGADGSPAWSPDGERLAFDRQTIPKFYGDMRRLMILDRSTLAVREIAADWDRSKTSLVWAADGERMVGAIDDAGTVRLYEIPLNGKPRALTSTSSFSNPALARNGALVALRQSFVEPPALVRVDGASGGEATVTKLSTRNDALLAETALGTYESVTYRGANGAEIQMWVSYPPGFDRTRKNPLFLLIHGGPHNGVTDGMQFRWNAQVFASWGYVTAWPNFHGSSGFGQKFADSINPRWDTLPYQDVIAAADWFAAQPWIDRDRMVAGGGSYGGYLASVLLGRPHRFKALIAHAAVYNLYTQWGGDTLTELPRFGGFWEPKQDEAFRAMSPHYGAASFATPTLVIHGERDMRVPINNGIELYQTLRAKGVPTRLLYYPDENHWVLKPQNSLLWYAEVKSWLERWTPPGGGATTSGAR